MGVAAIAGVLILGPGRLTDSGRLLGNVLEALASPGGTEAVRQRIAYTARGTDRIGDLYRGEAPAEAALVLVPGATPRGLDDPALTAFAGALAKSGFLVLVPRLAGEDPVRVSAADAAPIADALIYLTRRSGAERAGLAAISYAAGPAFLAALREETARRIAFLLAVGGYYDITAAVTYLTTGLYRPEPDAPWRAGPVDRRAKWRFLLANADRVSESEAPILRRIARLMLAEPRAQSDHLVARLGKGGTAAWRLLTNTDPERVPALIAALPRRLAGALAALDLSDRGLGELDFPILLVHGRDDPMVPPSESRALARALPEATTQLMLLDSLFHVQLGETGPLDAIDLFRLAYRIITLRDRAPAPRTGQSHG